MKLLLLTATSLGFQLSRLTLLTLLMWTPRFLWMPAQRMQRKMPRFQLAQRGPLLSQSTQYLRGTSQVTP